MRCCDVGLPFFSDEISTDEMKIQESLNLVLSTLGEQIWDNETLLNFLDDSPVHSSITTRRIQRLNDQVMIMKSPCGHINVVDNLTCCVLSRFCGSPLKCSTKTIPSIPCRQINIFSATWFKNSFTDRMTPAERSKRTLHRGAIIFVAASKCSLHLRLQARSTSTTAPRTALKKKENRRARRSDQAFSV